MEVIFTKAEAGCTTQCKRSVGSIEEWESPDGGAIPHDMIHWIVETKLNLYDSLFGNISAGQDHYSVNELAHNDSELAKTEKLVLLIQADLAIRDGKLHADPDAIRGLYGLEYPHSCDKQIKGEIICAIDDAAKDWSALSVGDRVSRFFS